MSGQDARLPVCNSRPKPKPEGKQTAGGCAPCCKTTSTTPLVRAPHSRTSGEGGGRAMLCWARNRARRLKSLPLGAKTKNNRFVSQKDASPHPAVFRRDIVIRQQFSVPLFETWVFPIPTTHGLTQKCHHAFPRVCVYRLGAMYVV